MGDEVEAVEWRLRELADWSEQDGDILTSNHESLVREAADAIESLRSSLTRVEEERDAAYMRAADLAETFQRDGSFDDSMVGAVEHNSNQANIAAAIRGLSRATSAEEA